jgi:hypothetical protein
MSRRFAAAALATGLLIGQPAWAQEQTKVGFAAGASRATFKGSIRGDRDHSYRVEARAGQILTVDFKPSNRSAYVNVTAPGADTALFIGSTSGNRFRSSALTAAGPYVVQVYLMRNAARRNEASTYRLTIGLGGGPAAASPASPGGDALVAGTPYNATAEVPCILAAGAAKTRCKAGVIRKGAGDATVEIEIADGARRRIFFKAGRPSGTDADAPMQATRAGDDAIIRIGPGERYEIPDAFVLGG